MAANPEENPYKGQNSFDVEDATLFFGRDSEAVQLTARVLANRLTVLHAASGAGKTSLLNAKIIPALEAHCWLPVRSTAETNPILAIRRDSLHSLFPPLEAEEYALADAVARLGVRDLHAASVDDLLAGFDALDVASPAHRRLLAPVKNRVALVRTADGSLERATPFASAIDIMPVFDRATPYVSRLLRKSVGISMLARHLAALRAAGLGHRGEEVGIDGRMSLDRLRSVLADPQLKQAYRALVSWLYRSPPGLRPFFENLVNTYGAEMRGVGVVLLLDQFEEVFTRFAGRPRATRRARPHSSTDAALDWRLRDELFDELERLHSASPEAGAEPGSGELPIRFVISLRDEYVARLGRLRQFVPDLETSMYRLGWLPIAEARHAIIDPADRYHYEYSPDCVDAIVSELAIEGQAIEPGPLQIVCYRLWEKRALRVDLSIKGLITLDTLKPEGVDGLLRGFFNSVLDDLSFFDQLEVLDILAPLITFSGTRNIVERKRLVEAEFRVAGPRSKLLDLLEWKRILRREQKLDGHYFEITHEFLIDPILNALKSNNAYERIDRAIVALRARLDGAISEPLPDHLFFTLDEHKARLRWSPAANELMFRTAVFHGAREPIVRDWAERYSNSASDVSEVLKATGFEGTRPLSSVELSLLAANLKVVTTPEEWERVASSLILSPEPLDLNVFRRAITQMVPRHGR